MSFFVHRLLARRGSSHKDRRRRSSLRHFGWNLRRRLGPGGQMDREAEKRLRRLSLHFIFAGAPGGIVHGPVDLRDRRMPRADESKARTPTRSSQRTSHQPPRRRKRFPPDRRRNHPRVSCRQTDGDRGLHAGRQLVELSSRTNTTSTTRRRKPTSTKSIISGFRTMRASRSNISMETTKSAAAR